MCANRAVLKNMKRSEWVLSFAINEGVLSNHSHPPEGNHHHATPLRRIRHPATPLSPVTFPSSSPYSSPYSSPCLSVQNPTCRLIVVSGSILLVSDYGGEQPPEFTRIAVTNSATLLNLAAALVWTIDPNERGITSTLMDKEWLQMRNDGRIIVPDANYTTVLRRKRKTPLPRHKRPVVLKEKRCKQGV